MDGRIGYDADFYAWTQEQARLLREAASDRSNSPIDWQHIAEELDIMGGQVKDAIQSHLATVIEHLLKLEHSPDPYPRRKWRASVAKARRHLADKLEDHPSLRDWPATILGKAYLDGYADAIQDDSLDIDALPMECAYALEDLRNPDWWPVNRHGVEG
eukprot:TRINITY_DN96179_c0_g1_i1.p2 TRINITY_DN96179_c0_g1~~TRINITY_DN96179_c0_g1_i1.p2  ORF type:complete len:158 (+),score=27.52 TRINITY_DN96179_c0_g1_i1:468-941(+)